MSYLWSRLFWRTIMRLGAAGLILGGAYFPIIFTVVLIFNFLFHASDYPNLGTTLIVYLLAVVFGSIYGGIFGAILGIILGTIQAFMLFVVLKLLFYPPNSQLPHQQILGISSGIISLVVTYIYFADFFPGMSGIMLILPLIITVIANVLMVRKIGDWYLSEITLSLSEEFQRANAGDEP